MRANSLHVVAAPLIARVDDAADNPAWDEFLITTPGGDIVQSSAWGRMKQAEGMTVARLLVEYEGAIVGGVQLVRRRVRPLGYVGYAPYGPVCSPAAPTTTHEFLVDALQEWMRRDGVRAFVAQPPQGGDEIARSLRAAGMQPTDTEVAPSASLRLDLASEPEELLARMTAQTRKDYRRSLREPIDVRFAERADLPSFHELYCCTAARQGFEPLPLAHLQAMWSALSPRGWIEIAMARVGGVDVAGSAVTCFGDTITGRFLGFDPARLPKRCRPNETLVWAIIEWARTRGYRWLDVGGLDRSEAVMLAAGVSPRVPRRNQKVGLGGDPVVYPEPLELIRNPVLRTARRLMRGNAAGRSLRQSFERRARSNVQRGGNR